MDSTGIYNINLNLEGAATFQIVKEFHMEAIVVQLHINTTYHCLKGLLIYIGTVLQSHRFMPLLMSELEIFLWKSNLIIYLCNN